MGLDVYLLKKNTQNETNEDSVFWANITHNLTEMADEAGVYEALWRPYRLKNGYVKTDNYEEELRFEDSQVVLALEIINPLREGLHKLKIDASEYEKFNPENGWGSRVGLVEFIEKYLNACYENQDAVIKVSR
jgi:hypothetical protein